MASPQIENGYTMVANEILEVFAKTDMNGTQRRILDVIVRQTYGYKRTSHDLSISFIAVATNIHIKQIQRELNKLIEKNIVKVVAEATFSKPRQLAINKDYDSWNSGEVANQLPPNEIDTHTGSELVPSRGSELAPQIKKERKLKEIYIISSDELKFLEVLESITNYPIDRNKDLTMYNTLKDKYPTLDLLEAIENWKIYKLDKPLEKKSNARSQINTSFKNYVQWDKHTKKVTNQEPLTTYKTKGSEEIVW